MAGIIARQPNGLLCRFSTVTDTITAYNMTEEEYIELCADRAREEAKEVLQHYVKDFEYIKDDIKPNSNMSKKEVTKILKEMGV